MRFGEQPDKPADDAEKGQDQQEAGAESSARRQEPNLNTFEQFMGGEPYPLRSEQEPATSAPSPSPTTTSPDKDAVQRVSEEPAVETHSAGAAVSRAGIGDIMPVTAARQVIQHCTFGATGMKLRPGSHLVTNVPALRIPYYQQLPVGKQSYLPWLAYLDNGALCVFVARDHAAECQIEKERLLRAFADASYTAAKIEEVDAEPGELRLLASMLRDMPADRSAVTGMWSPAEGEKANARALFAVLQSDLHVHSVRRKGRGWSVYRDRLGWQEVISPELKDALDRCAGTAPSLRLPMLRTEIYPFEDISAGMEASAVDALHKTTSLAVGACIIGGPGTGGAITTAASVANVAAKIQDRSACAVGIEPIASGDADWLHAETIEDAGASDAGIILWNTEMSSTLGRHLAKILESGKLVIVNLCSPSLVETLENLLLSGATTAFFTQSVSGIFHQIRVPLLCPDCSLYDDRDSTLSDLGFSGGVTFNAKRRGSGPCPTCGGHHVLREATLIEALEPSSLERNIKKSLFMDRNMIDADQAIIAKKRLWNSGLYHYVLRGEMDIDDLRKYARRY